MSFDYQEWIKGFSIEELNALVTKHTKELEDPDLDLKLQTISGDTLGWAESELKKRDGEKRYRDGKGNLRDKHWGNVVGCGGHIHSSIIPNTAYLNSCNYLACGVCNKCGQFITHKDTHGVNNRDYIENDILEEMGVI